MMVIDLMKCSILGKNLAQIKEFQEKVLYYWIEGFSLKISRELAGQEQEYGNGHRN